MRRIILLMITSLLLICVGCTGKIPTINDIENKNEEIKATVKPTNTPTPTPIDEINIFIDGDISDLNENKNNNDKNNNNKELGTNLTQTNLVKQIILALQENQTNYTTDVSLQYKGSMTESTKKKDAVPSIYNFVNTLNYSYKLGYSGNSSIIGGGTFYADNNFYEKETNNYNIEKYYYKKVLYSNELEKNEIKWRKKEMKANNYPSVKIDRNNLSEILNKANLTEEKNFYLFTINSTFAEIFDTFEVGIIDEIFKKNEIYNSNITFQIKFDKKNYLPTKLVFNKSYNNATGTLNNSIIYNLTPDIKSNIELNKVKSYQISKVSLNIDFTFNKNEEILIKDAYVWEANNDLIPNKFKHLTELTKYDYKYIYHDKHEIIATFDSSYSGGEITCSAYDSGLCTDFYFAKQGQTSKRYYGTLTLLSQEELEYFYLYNLDEKDILKIPYKDCYLFNYDGIDIVYIKINDTYGFIYTNENKDINTDILTEVLEYINF